MKQRSKTDSGVSSSLLCPLRTQDELVVTDTVEVPGDWTCLEPTYLAISASEDTGL